MRDNHFSDYKESKFKFRYNHDPDFRRRYEHWKFCKQEEEFWYNNFKQDYYEDLFNRMNNISQVKIEESKNILNIVSITKEDITNNFRRLSKIYHPDLGGDAEEFKKIYEAKETLLATL